MTRQESIQENLIEKIRTLPTRQLAEVVDFVDFLRSRLIDRELRQASAKLSEESFRRVWDNPDDAEYDHL
ncbi:MAG: toxin-antitoxin system, antitoxin component, Xre family protein [Acidobacteriota bacterium]